MKNKRLQKFLVETFTIALFSFLFSTVRVTYNHYSYEDYEESIRAKYITNFWETWENMFFIIAFIYIIQLVIVAFLQEVIKISLTIKSIIFILIPFTFLVVIYNLSFLFSITRSMLLFILFFCFAYALLFTIDYLNNKLSSFKS